VCCMFYTHINYHYIMGDQRMMSFGISGSPPPFLANKMMMMMMMFIKNPIMFF